MARSDMDDSLFSEMFEMTKKAKLMMAGILLLVLMTAAVVYAEKDPPPGDAYRCEHFGKVAHSAKVPPKEGCLIGLGRVSGHRWIKADPPANRGGSR